MRGSPDRWVIRGGQQGLGHGVVKAERTSAEIPRTEAELLHHQRRQRIERQRGEDDLRTFEALPETAPGVGAHATGSGRAPRTRRPGRSPVGSPSAKVSRPATNVWL